MYKEKFDKFRPAVEYFRLRLAKTETADAATKADMMANVLIQAGLELHTLIDIAEEDNAWPSKNKKLRNKLLQILQGEAGLFS